MIRFHIKNAMIPCSHHLERSFGMSNESKVIPDCPVEMTLQLIGDRWKVLIIRDLLTGTKRFGELKKSVGNISQKVLTHNLRAMEESGLLTRKVYPEVPPRVEYTLTDIGYSLEPILDSMKEWGIHYQQKYLSSQEDRISS